MAYKHYINLTLLSLIPLLATAATPPPSPVASSPPPNITNILQKADEFTRFIGLLRSSQVADRLETQLDPNKTSNNQASSSFGLTILAPNDNGFSGLKPGSLNSLSYDQMAKLVLFHCIPSFLSFSDFKTAVNPIRTEAGDVGRGQYPLNVTTFATQVNFSTGVDRDHVSVSSTIYSNSTERLAIYEVDRLLAPMAVFPVSPFQDQAPAPAPGPSSELKHKKKDDGDDADGVAPVADGGSTSNVGDRGSRPVRASTSGGASMFNFYFYHYVVFGVCMILVCF